MTRVLALLLAALAWAAVPATATEFQMVILKNGMRVAMKEDHSNPLITVVVAIHAGSSRESKSTSGMTHLLEHMIFDGTTTRTREQIQRGFDRYGGYNNAFTREDFTAHQIVMPSELIEKGLALQSDMLFHSTLPPRELEKERKVVIEELRGGTAGNESKADLFFNRNLYAGTAYENPTLGSEASINAVSRDALLRFYHAFYRPASMAAIVMGDFEPRKMRALLEKYYGSEPGGKAPASNRVSAPRLSGIRALYQPLPNAKACYLNVALPAPPVNSPDAPAFELLAQVLAGEGSRLDSALVSTKTRLAYQVSGGYNWNRGGGVLTVSALVPLDVDVRKTAAGVLGEIARLRQSGVEGWELDRAKLTERTGRIFESERPVYVGSDLALWDSVAGIGTYERFVSSMVRVTPGDLKAVARRYLTGKQALITVSGPKGPGELFPLPAWKGPESARKAPGTKPAGKNRAPARAARTLYRVLSNGLRVIAVEDATADIVSADLLIGNRSALEPRGKEGIAHFVSVMLDKVPGGSPYSAQFAAIGAQVKLVPDGYGFDDYYTSRDYSYARLETLGEYFDAGFKLFGRMIREPAFPGSEVEQQRKQIRTMLENRAQSPYRVAQDSFYATLFGDGPHGRPIYGTPESVAAITQADLIAYHHAAYSPENMVLALVGNRRAESLLAAAEREFGRMTPVRAPLQAPPDSPPPAKTTVVLKPIEDQTQAQVTLGYELPGIESPDAPAIQAAALVLDGRLNEELREKQGFAYSVGAGAEMTRGTGSLTIGLATEGRNAETARQEILRQIAGLQSAPPSAEELEAAVNSAWGRYLRYRQSRVNRAHFLALCELLGQGYRFDADRIRRLRAVTPEQTQAVAKRYFRTDRYVLVVAGDVKPGLTE